MIDIDSCAYNNLLKDVHPSEKLLFALLTLIVCLTSPANLTPVIVFALMAGGSIFKAGISARLFAKLMLVPLSFLLLSIVTIALSVSASSAGFLVSQRIGSLIIGIRYPDLLTAIHLFAKSLGAVACLYFLALTTPMTEVITILGRLRVPLIITELMVLIYRFIFVLMDTASTIHRAQSSRLGYVSSKSSFRSISRLFSALLGKVLLNSQELFYTMEARGYTGEIKVLSKKYPIIFKNYLIITLLEILLILINLFGR